MKPTRFNIRVYFLIVNEKNQLLLSDEILGGRKCTKFPGGGLEFGEGLIDCCKREALEELGQEIEVERHLYTTDFFVRSAFHSADQVVAVYYLARLTKEPDFEVSDRRFGFKEQIERAESRRWASLDDFNDDELTFVSDRTALELLKKSRTLN